MPYRLNKEKTMKLTKTLYTLAAVITMACGCSKNSSEPTQYNQYIEAFTSGNVSRHAKIVMMTSTDIDVETMGKVDANDVMSISPKAEGKFTYADTHTIVFTPKGELERDTKYTVVADLSRWFDTEDKFQFQFTTLPLNATCQMTSLDIDEDGNYVLWYEMTTADEESEDTMKKCVSASAGSITHSGSADKRRHIFSVNVESKAKVVDITFDFGNEKKVVESTELASSETFAVNDVKFRKDDTHYIEVTFNMRLDETKNYHGLAYIEGNTSEQVDVDGNKLRLYPDNGVNGDVVVFISGSIKSKSGKELGNDVRRSVMIPAQKPMLEFVGQGTIVPQADKAKIPFRAIYMRGAKVRVFKIFPNNIGSIMQNGDVNGYERLMYAGVPVAVTTLFFDETDFSQWRNYAIDLSKMVDTEPGTMYRIELGMDRRLSAWPSDSIKNATREEMEAEDKVENARVKASFANGGWYYMSDIDWNVYSYRDAENPETLSYYMDKRIGRNVLATNIGLTAIMGEDNKMNIVATDLPSASGMSDVIIEAYSMQNQIISTATTDGNGHAEIDLTPNAGKALYIRAKKGGDISYMKVRDGEELSTSRFDVAGEVVQKGLKGFIYGDRSVWRPGDTLHISFMLNDRVKSLPANHPVSLELRNPNGQVAAKQTKGNGKHGIYAFNIPTDVNAPTGMWVAEVNVGGVTYSKNLRIETIKPNRLKIDLKLPQVMTKGETPATLSTEWLNGAKTHGMKYEISANFVPAKTTWDSFKDYSFDDITKSYKAEELNLADGTTDNDGKASPIMNIRNVDGAAGMLRCNVTTRVYEPSGEFSTDVQQTKCSPYTRYVGIKSPQTDRSALATGKWHTFDIVSVDANGKPSDHDEIAVTVYKVDWYWWWSSTSSDLANYTTYSYNTPIRNKKLTTDANGKAEYKYNVSDNDWGTYLICAKNVQSGHSTAILSYFDWPNAMRQEDGREMAIQLQINTDKESYKPGEKVKITIPSSDGSKAIVSICNGTNIVSQDFVTCGEGQTEIKMDVTEEMIPNAYVMVSLVQPYKQTVNDMPIRLFGVTPITVNDENRRLRPSIEVSDVIRPMEQCKVTVGEEKGREMAYTLAIVDEGLLDLTRFKTPNPWAAFNAREALGVRTWDLYSHVSGAFGGRIEQMFSIGGDEALYNGPKAIVNRFTPMVYFDGPYVIGKGKKHTHTINVPNYNGRVRVMVVASNGESFGSSDKSVMVRKPLMLTGTMPRQIGIGDEATVSATIFATENGIGNVEAKITVGTGLEVVGEKSIKVSFSEQGDKTVQFRIKATKSVDNPAITITATSSKDKAVYTTQLKMRTVSQHIYKTTLSSVNAGQALNQKLEIPEGNGVNHVTVEVSQTKPLNIAGRLRQLMEYPHGCAEQTTSKAYPQLFLGQFTQLSEQQASEIESNVKTAIEKLYTYQTIDGGMAYWPGQLYTNAQYSAYILNFYKDAEAHGYYVRQDVVKRLQDFMKRWTRNWNTTQSVQDECYALYVLANINSAELSAMNRMKEIADKLDNTSKYYLAAAYAKTGHADVAKQLLAKAGSTYNTSAQFIAYNAVNDTRVAEIAESTRASLASEEWLSTSQTAQMIIAMAQYYAKHPSSDEMDFNIKFDKGDKVNVKTKANSWNDFIAENVKGGAFTLNNKGKGTLWVNTIVDAIAEQCKVASNENGLAVSVSYSDIPNNDPNHIAQGTTFKVDVTVKNTSGKKLENVAVTHILPAGWEVLKTQVSSPSYQDVRDDRVLSYFDNMNVNQSYTIHLDLIATYAGEYYMPAVSAEAMYDAKISGCTDSDSVSVEN